MNMRQVIFSVLSAASSFGLTETAVTADPPVTGHCPDSRWVEFGGGYCYLISDQSLSWGDGRAE